MLSNMISSTDVKNLKKDDIVIEAPKIRDDIFSAIDMLIAGI
ncbi:hypothetical protein [Photorhabdus sp. SF281]